MEKQQTVRVLARITAQPHRVDELTHVLQRLVEETRKEKSCLSYQLYQNLDDPADFTVVEEWASDAAIDSHLATTHVQEAFAKAASLLAATPETKRYRVIG